MNSATNPSVVDNCTRSKIILISEWYTHIEKCEKALKDYLEVKKKVFPRFYFLPDDTLLDVLSNGKYPLKVAKYLKACFIGLTNLKFIPPKKKGMITKQAIGMYSKEGEYVKFDNGKIGETVYEAMGEVEHWLNDLEFMMKLSLNTQLGIARETARETWETV